jgi:hypothetical protein
VIKLPDKSKFTNGISPNHYTIELVLKLKLFYVNLHNINDILIIKKPTNITIPLCRVTFWNLASR